MRRRGKRLDLYCHDLFQPYEVHGALVDIEKRFDEGVAHWGFEPTKVKGRSCETVDIHEDASLDYCFVDGDHTYEGALADITSFAPKVKPDGWLVIQDSIGDVDRALNDALSDTDWNAVLVSPPQGHFVTVCNRNADLLNAFAEGFHAVMSSQDTEAPCHHFPDVICDVSKYS
jgi:hypothetical protein